MTRLPFGIALAPVAIAATLALQTSATLPDAGARAGLGFGCGVAVLVAFAARRRAPRFARCLALAALGGALLALAADRAADRLADRLPPALEGVALRLVGIVDELPVAMQGGQRFVVRVERCARLAADPADPVDAADRVDPTIGTDVSACRAPSRVQLTWQVHPRARDAPSPATVRPGERWSFEVSLKRPHAPVNPGAFDRELRWLQEGIGAVGRVRAGVRSDARAGGAAIAVERARAAIRDALFDAAGEGGVREAGVLAALAVGDQAAIDADLWALYNATGTAHLMSISGLHITMLAGLGGAIAGRIGRLRAVARAGVPLALPIPIARLAAAVTVGIGYALLAGWGVPAQRTVWMLAVAALTLATGRTASVAAAVSLAAVTIAAIDPWAPLAAGFWLSFGAVIAIVWANASRHHESGRAGRAMRGALRTQLAASVALLPLGAWYFASVASVGPLANALAIPVVSALVAPLALAGGALALVSVEAASWLLAPALLALDALHVALGAMAAWPAATVALARPDGASVAVALAGAALLLAPIGVPHRAAGALALLPLAFVPLDRPAPGTLRLTALDVGQGMAVAIEIADGVLLYDTGPTLAPGIDAGQRVIVPWLRARGIARLDLLVVSHADDDHAGGARSVLRAMPATTLVSPLPDGHPIAAAAAATRRCTRGERWRWGEAELEWLHPADPPERARGSPTNALSCVLRVRHPGGTVLLAGDIEAVQERRLVELHGRDGLAADVLLVPHHGSATSSTETFLEAVSPRIAIVQAAYRNRFRHPHPRVVERYARRDVTLLRSDADGAITLVLRIGAPPGVTRSRLEPARYWRVDALPP